MVEENGEILQNLTKTALLKGFLELDGIYLVGARSPTGLVQMMFRSNATPSTVATN